MKLDARWSQRVLQAIEAEEEASKERICTLLRTELQRAFDFAHQRFPHWTGLRFGNGTFVVIGMSDEEEQRLCYRMVPVTPRAQLRELRAADLAQERLGLAIPPREMRLHRVWQGPKWLQHLFALCEEYAGRTVDDIYPTSSTLTPTSFPGFTC